MFSGLNYMNQFLKECPKPVHTIDPKYLSIKLLLQKGLYVLSVSDYDILKNYVY